MGFFRVTHDEESVKDYEGGNSAYISKSGIYPVIIKHVIVDKSPNGSEFINLWIEHEGQDQPIFQAMRMTNNDGSPNLGAKTFNKFAIVAGATENDEISDPVPVMVPIGKGGEEKECMILEQFDNTPMYMRVQMEYSMYNGEIKETKAVRNFFRYEDKATASEIVNNAENKGSQYAKEEEYADKITYKDGLTEEDVQQWLKDRKSGKKTEKKDNKPSGGFGGKRNFGKKN